MIIPGDSGDGTCYNTWGDWTICRLGNQPKLIDDTNYIRSVSFLTASYWMYRGFIYFGLSHVDPGLVVQTAKLRLFGKAKGSSGVTVVVTEGTFNIPLVAVAYQGHAATATVLGSIATPDVTLEAYNDIVLNQDGIDLVQSKVGDILKFCLKDQDDNDDDPMVYDPNRNFDFYSGGETTILRPNGPGDYTNLIKAGSAGSNWESVAEVVADDFTTWVRTGNVSQLKDAYELSALPAASAVSSVKIYFRVSSSGDGALRGYAQPFLRLSGVETTGTEMLCPFYVAPGWATYSETLTRPGGGGWTVADIASLQACVGIRSPGGEWVNCTQVYVEVDYTPAVWTPPLLVLGTGMSKSQALVIG